jgi:hypothetical protein
MRVATTKPLRWLNEWAVEGSMLFRIVSMRKG